MRPAYSLAQLLIALVLLSLLASIAAPRLGAGRDRALVRQGSAELVAALAAARGAAVRRGTRAALVVDPALGEVRVVSGGAVLAERPLRALLGVSVSATRDSITFGPSGRGAGAANTTIVVRRGAAVDSVIVSRLGRVRR